METKPPNITAPSCQHGGHKACARKFGGGMSLIGRNRQLMAMLCAAPAMTLGVRAARQWSPTLPDHQPPVSNTSARHAAGANAHNRSELTNLGVGAVRYGMVAGATAVGASLTNGMLRVILAVVAAVFAGIAAWVALWYLGIDTILHISRNTDRRK